MKFIKAITYMSTVIMLLMLSSCGVSYVVPKAIFHVDFESTEESGLAHKEIVDYLEKREFVNNGKDEQMLRSFESMKKRNSNSDAVASYDRQILMYQRQTNFSNDSLGIKIDLINYSDVENKSEFLNYDQTKNKVTDKPALAVYFYNYRPGGFSAEAILFYDELIATIEKNTTGMVNVIKSYPLTDQDEYYRVQISNILTMVFWWLVVYFAMITAMGTLITRGLKRTSLNIVKKRLLFSLLCVLLFTPLPVPTMFITLYFPGAIVLLGADLAYFSWFQNYVISSVVASILLTSFLSVRMIKKS